MSAILGYLRNLPPTHNEIKPFGGNALGKGLIASNLLIPASLGKPITAYQTTPDSGTLEYGAYVLSIAACRDCHSSDLGGGSDPENGMPVPNLTPGGELSHWTQSDFLTAMHTGEKPDGTYLSTNMPFEEYGRMNDDDLIAIFNYLQSLPAVDQSRRTVSIFNEPHLELRFKFINSTFGKGRIQMEKAYKHVSEQTSIGDYAVSGLFCGFRLVS